MQDLPEAAGEAARGSRPFRQSFKSKKAPREYRNLFSNAYQMLYKGENNLLYYLNEIIDSAQEGKTSSDPSRALSLRQRQEVRVLPSRPRVRA